MDDNADTNDDDGDGHDHDDDDDGHDHHDKDLLQIHKWREGRTDEGERPRTYDKFYQVFFEIYVFE